MRRLLLLAPIALVTLGGCLASKGDIRLLQDELRVSRAQQAMGDTSILQADAARRAQLAALSAKVDRMNDSLRVLAGRVASFQGTTNSQFDAIGQQMVQMQALLGQTTRNLQDTRAQLAAIREQGGLTQSGPPPVSADTSQRAAAGLPGASTLFLTAKEQLDNGAFGTARRGFEQLLAAYPNSDQAPRAMLYIGDAYKGEGNLTAADSVYQLIPNRYPKSPEAATGLYRHGRMLWDANKRGEARVVLNRLMRDYPNSDEYFLARDLLNPRE